MLAILSRQNAPALLLFIVSLVVHSAVVYFSNFSLMRLGLSVLFLAPIIWAAAHLDVAEDIEERLVPGPYGRRFIRLRTRVDHVLAEVRRLNWMAVEGDRGFRDRDEAVREMDAIEESLVQMIVEIRQVAGRREPGYVDKGPVPVALRCRGGH